jgi:hypothetical protein
MDKSAPFANVLSNTVSPSTARALASALS